MLTSWNLPGQTARRMDRIPPHFEPNTGQTDAAVRFTARAGGMHLYLTDRETVIVKHGAEPVRMKLLGSRAAKYEALEKQAGVSNYYFGNDPRKWRAKVPHYARVRAKGVYEGVDVVYYGNGQRLEYDFIVAPGVSPSVIQLAYEGAESMRVDDVGDLVLVTRAGELRQHKPAVYQEIGGRRVEVAGSYRMRGGRVSFEVARYDRSAPLVIDPVLSYGTFLGGSSQDFINGLATDTAGNAIVAGSTRSADFPGQGTALDSAASSAAFVTKINAAGNALLYSTYLGGRLDDAAHAVAVNAQGSAVFGGYTWSPDFPLRNAFQSARGSAFVTDGFVASLDANGALVFASYLGGAEGDFVNGVALDGTGIYLAGNTSSPDFPGAASGNSIDHAFVVKLNPSASSRIYARTMAFARASSIAVDGAGAAYVAGDAFAGFQATAGAFQTSALGSDAFVAKVNPSGSGFTYATLLGGSNSMDIASAIAVDASGQAHVTGVTNSADFPTRNAIDAVLGSGPSSAGTSDAFVTAINATGTGLVYSTFLGGADAEWGKGIAVTANGVFVTGQTSSADFPVVSAWQSALEGTPVFLADAFLVRLTATGGAITWSTLFGGAGGDSGTAVAVDASGAVFMVGYSQGPSNLGFSMTTAGAFDQTANGDFDGFIAKFTDGPPAVNITFASVPSGRQLLIDGRSVVTPASIPWQPGTAHRLSAPSPQTLDGGQLIFSNWAHGGGATQTVIAPASPTTYMANFSGAACNFVFAPASKQFGFEGGAFDVVITTSTACQWTPETTAGWLTYESTNLVFPLAGSRTLRYRAAINYGGTRTASVTVNGAALPVAQSGGAAPLGTPNITAPSSGQTQQGRGVNFIWTPVSGASGYEVRVLTLAPEALHQTIYRGQQSGASSTAVAIDLANGDYIFVVRACTAAGFGDANCGGWANLPVKVDLLTPRNWPAVLRPAHGDTLTSSTNVIEWDPVPGATAYEVWLVDWQRNETALRIVTPGTSTIFTMKSGSYYLAVGACQAACNASQRYSFARTVNFRVQLPAPPTSPPTGLTAQVQNGNSLTVNWNPVANADLYRVQVVQQGAGPGGSALSVAARQTSTPGLTLPVPAGAATVLVQACTGDGCGPPASAPINAAGPNPATPNVGTPMAVINADGPDVLITWNRIPGDNGSNTTYRLYVGDLSLDAPALDVRTTSNFHGAKLRAEGRRYDALVFATQGAGPAVVGPASGFMVVGQSATAPAMSSPTHNSTFRQGVQRLRWSPITDAVRYQYVVTKQGAPTAALSGITPGLFVDLHVPALDGQTTTYNAIVRACPLASASQCTADSDAGWGPWSQNVTGVATFTVTP